MLHTTNNVLKIGLVIAILIKGTEVEDAISLPLKTLVFCI